MAGMELKKRRTSEMAKGEWKCSSEVSLWFVVGVMVGSSKSRNMRVRGVMANKEGENEAV